MREALRLRGKALVGAIAAAVIVLAAAGVGAWLLVRDDSSPSIHRAITSEPDLNAPSHAAYARLYTNAIVKKTRIDVLHKWPSPPYQTFSSGTNHCYEWYDKPTALYTLCFKNGMLTDKAIS